MDQELINLNLIPLDKSWIIRMGILDMVAGCDDISIFLSQQKNLGDDLLALKNAAQDWNSKQEINVGESGTLYRLLKFASWKLKLDKKFITEGTLKDRKITDDPNIVNLSQEKLLELDNKTSQWATAVVLLGDVKRITNPPFKLKLTYEAVDHWQKQRKQGKVWEPKYDETILNQADAFAKLLKKEKVDFIPEQAEDYCFAYTFGFITQEEGEQKWPSLRGHESDRIKEMNEVLDQAKMGKEITSKDHRVVQAVAMWSNINEKPVNILYPESVNKSWPQFWEFLKFIEKSKNYRIML
jgi:hypothetical protein